MGTFSLFGFGAKRDRNNIRLELDLIKGEITDIKTDIKIIKNNIERIYYEKK